MQEIENVRVAVRLKPLTQEEIEKGVQEIIVVEGSRLTLLPSEEEVEEPLGPQTPKRPSHSRVLRPMTPGAPSKAGTIPRTPQQRRMAKEFGFDRVYGAQTSQEELFRDVEGYVDAAVGGYRATVCCYGQTGAGKTHSLLGSPTAPGIVPRALERVFGLVGHAPRTLFALSLSVVEWQGHRFVDLLAPPSPSPPPLRLREDATTRGVWLEGSATLRTPVSTLAEASRLLHSAIARRRVAGTKMNEQSSRSHLIISLRIESREGENNSVLVGQLEMVDLAGAERLNKSGAEGERAKEAQQINSSLTALGDVLAALSSTHYNGPIPYRNSKFTRLLQGSLGGNSKTFFLVNVHNCPQHYQETLMALLYGQRAKKVKNITSLNKDLNKDSELELLHQEVVTLRQRLIARTKEFEQIKARDASTKEENEQLKVLLKREIDQQSQVSVLSSITQKEVERLEAQLNDVIHSKPSEFYDLSYQLSTLQREMDNYREEKRKLELQLVLRDDETDDLKGEILTTQQQLQKTQSQLSTAKEAQHRLEKELSESESFRKEQLRTIKTLQSQIARWEKDSLQEEKVGRQQAKKEEALTLQLEEQEKELMLRNEEIGSLKEEVETLKELNASLSTQLSEKETALTLAKETIESLEQQLTAAEQNAKSSQSRKRKSDGEETSPKKLSKTTPVDDQENMDPTNSEEKPTAGKRGKGGRGKRRLGSRGSGTEWVEEPTDSVVPSERPSAVGLQSLFKYGTFKVPKLLPAKRRAV